MTTNETPEVQTYTDITGRTQFAVVGAKRNLLVTKSGTGGRWHIWWADQIRDIARFRDFDAAIAHATVIVARAMKEGR